MPRDKEPKYGVEDGEPNWIIDLFKWFKHKLW